MQIEPREYQWKVVAWELAQELISRERSIGEHDIREVNDHYEFDLEDEDECQVGRDYVSVPGWYFEFPRKTREEELKALIKVCDFIRAKL